MGDDYIIIMNYLWMESSSSSESFIDSHNGFDGLLRLIEKQQ